MLPVSKLNDMRDESNKSLAALQKASAKLQEQIAALQEDKTRTKDFTFESVRALRDKVIPVLSEPLKEIQTIAQDAAGQKRFWESKSFLLSKEKFPVADEAMMRLATAQELQGMPIKDLQLVFDAAKTEKNLPVLYQAWRALDARRLEAREHQIYFDLNDVEIPGLLAAQTTFQQVKANRLEAENIFSTCAGMRNDPVKKMTAGRQQNAAKAAAAREAAAKA